MTWWRQRMFDQTGRPFALAGGRRRLPSSAFPIGMHLCARVFVCNSRLSLSLALSLASVRFRHQLQRFTCSLLSTGSFVHSFARELYSPPLCIMMELLIVCVCAFDQTVQRQISKDIFKSGGVSRAHFVRIRSSVLTAHKAATAAASAGLHQVLSRRHLTN